MRASSFLSIRKAPGLSSGSPLAWNLIFQIFWRVFSTSFRSSAGGYSRISEICMETVKLSEHTDKLVKAYSQGMKQRLGIAASLLGEPGIIILDEPTNGLDPGGIVEIREVIKNITKDHGITVFLSSHLLKEVEQMCTRVAIISKGKLAVEGEVETLLKSDKDVRTLEEYFLKYIV